MNTPGQDDAEILDRPVPLEGEETRKMRVKVRRRLPGRRLDKYLHSRVPRMSRTLLQRLIKQGAVTVNGLPTKASYEPTAGDVVELIVPPPEPADVVPEDIPLEIIYEDEYVLAINKPAGIICHPARGGQTGTVANAVAFYADQLSHGSDPFRPGIVHRLDKNTTGVMLIAKTDEAHWRLAMQFERRTVEKTYFAIVEGEPRLDGDIIDMPLGAHPTIKDRYIVPGMPVRPMLFKEAVTHYQVARRFKGFAIVHLHPKTGRTHQLRVHMSAIGHPVLGDTFYGGHLFSARDISGDESASTEVLIGYQSLHAQRIRFVHPVREQPMTIEAALPAELQSIVDLLGKHRAWK